MMMVIIMLLLLKMMIMMMTTTMVVMTNDTGLLSPAIAPELSLAVVVGVPSVMMMMMAGVPCSVACKVG